MLTRLLVLVTIACAGAALSLGLPGGPSTAQAGLPFPDLIIVSISDAQQPFTNCQTPAGVKVVVKNQGAASAAASTTRVSVSSSGSFENVTTPALGPAESVTIFSFVQGIPSGDTYTATADFTSVIIETDETNNSLSQFLSLSTLPTCTPTPSPTPPPPVGGLAGAPGITQQQGSRTSTLIALAAGAALLAGAGWYGRRRVRQS
jgi:LPXTG-motif cell wall-anchored protein